jgi:hypothetical protein
MRNLLDGIIRHSELGMWPAVGMVILMGTMLAIIWRLFVRGNVAEYQRLAMICTDGDQKK